MNKLITFLLFGVVSICSYAQKFEYEGLNYQVLSDADKTCEVTRNYDVPSNVIIPEKVTYNDSQYTVTSIGERAFYGCNIFSVILPEGVTTIGSYAFGSCELVSITLPESLTSIEWGAFSNCSMLPSITLPKNLASIGEYAFQACLSLREINVVVENEHYASYEGVLFSKDLTTLITCPQGKSGEYIVPNGVTTIGDYSFYSCWSLSSITLPESVTSIGDFSFFDCWVLTEINVAVENKNYASLEGVLFSKDLTTLIKYPEAKTGDYTVPNGVVSIGDYAFYRCTLLTCIELPTSVTSIGNYAFSQCYSLTSVILPESLTLIGEGAFESCENLLSITLPTGLTSIGNAVFGWCTNLLSITLPESVTSIGNATFKNCESLTSIILPESLITMGYEAFSGCSRLPSITLPESLISIGNWAFENCESLKTVNSYATNPPVCNYSVFLEISSDAVLHVPVGTKDDYADAEGWSRFYNIIDDLNEYSGVEGIDSETLEINADDVIEVYNLQGSRMNIVRRNELPSLPAGIYIVNGKKIIVK